ncbi:MAG: SUMF1/EgtB/PvdO family nonheme iron enzyme [Desulforhopalus sp.]
MSQFKTKLDKARGRQKLLYLVTGSVVTTCLLLVTLLFVVSRGTRIEIIPEEAKGSAVINVTKGLGFSIGNTVYSLVGTSVVTATAPGFKAASVPLGSTHLGKVLPVELFELPGRLRIDLSEVSVDLSQTAWRINNRDAAIAEKLDIELEAGAYKVAVDNPFFQLQEVELEIERGELTQLQINLQPVAGVFFISSIPSGSSVFLDEKEVGLTPLQLEQGGGHHTIRLAAENYIDTTEQLAITRTNPEVKRNYRLERKKAKVVLDLMPPGGKLLVNGTEAAGVVMLDASVEHRLTYMKAGYYPKTETVLLAAGEEKKLLFRLKPETGKVAIVSSPPAAVFIGNKDYGMSPVNVDLPALAHKIVLRKTGYRTVTKTVQPKGGTVQKVSATLLTEYQARLQEAPREFTNKEGVTLKLFVVQDSLTMGAPRSEKGQRANEFEQKIRLTKPFYASFFEITNRQFTRYDPQKGRGVPTAPVTSISWQEAAAYCNWLSDKEKIRPFYKTSKGIVTGFDVSSDGYRLLSEGEWEWLARKSGKTRQTIFTWGNDTVIPPGTANIADESAKGRVRFYVPNYNDGIAGVAPAGSFNREPSGLYDMAGNVSEWVHNVYSIVPPPTSAVVSNPMGQQRGAAYVIKGANFRSGTLTALRPAFREGLSKGRDDVGFRIGRYLYGGDNE